MCKEGFIHWQGTLSLHNMREKKAETDAVGSWNLRWETEQMTECWLYSEPVVALTVLLITERFVPLRE